MLHSQVRSRDNVAVALRREYLLGAAELHTCRTALCVCTFDIGDVARAQKPDMVKKVLHAPRSGSSPLGLAAVARNERFQLRRAAGEPDDVPPRVEVGGSTSCCRRRPGREVLDQLGQERIPERPARA